jgi:hypothetical protein
MGNDNLKTESNNANVLLGAGFVYLVECSSGSWDSYHWWVGGIFEKQEDADKYAQSLNDENKRLKEVECSIKTPFEDMTDEEETEYYRWWNGNNDAMEWNGAKVKQYPINKPCT